eukprot:1445191-Pyramimonas_sp.AAC.1
MILPVWPVWRWPSVCRGVLWCPVVSAVGRAKSRQMNLLLPPVRPSVRGWLAVSRGVPGCLV